MNSKTNKQPARKYVAYNPQTRKYEECAPDFKPTQGKVITMYWSNGFQKYFTIPEND